MRWYKVYRLVRVHLRRHCTRHPVVPGRAAPYRLNPVMHNYIPMFCKQKKNMVIMDTD